MPMGMVLCGFLRLLGGGRDGLEADVGEEDHPGRRGDMPSSRMRLRVSGVGVSLRDEGMPVVGVDVMRRRTRSR